MDTATIRTDIRITDIRTCSALLSRLDLGSDIVLQFSLDVPSWAAPLLDVHLPVAQDLPADQDLPVDQDLPGGHSPVASGRAVSDVSAEDNPMGSVAQKAQGAARGTKQSL